MIAINNIRVATDFSEPADAALKYGRAFAGRFGATLHVMHVIGDVSSLVCGADTADAVVAGARARTGESKSA